MNIGCIVRCRYKTSLWKLDIGEMKDVMNALYKECYVLLPDFKESFSPQFGYELDCNCNGRKTDCRIVEVCINQKKYKLF